MFVPALLKKATIKFEMKDPKPLYSFPRKQARLLVFNLVVVDLEGQSSIKTVQAPARSAREAVRRKHLQAQPEPFLQWGEIFMLELDGKVLQPALSPNWVGALWRDVRVVIILPAGGIAVEVAQ